MTGEKFLRGLITPIDPKNIFFMLQSGYAADFILALTVESLNGVRNSSTARGTMQRADPDFVQALRLMREVQAEGAMGMRVEEDKAKGATGIIFFQRDNVSPEIAAKAAEVRRLLRLPEGSQRVTLVYSPMRGGEGELSVNSRSMLQIMGAISAFVDVPAAHIADRSASEAFANTSGRSSRTSASAHPQRHREACQCLCRRAIPRSLVLGGPGRLADQARHDCGDVLLHARGYGHA